MKTLESMGIAAKSAASILAGATAKQKNDLLITAANDLIDATAELIRANEIDIENLMKEYSGFHDSCIVSINYHSGAFVNDKGAMANGGLLEHSIEMILHSQCNKPIELRFTGVRKCNIVGWEDNYFCDIFGAYLNFHSDLLGKTRDDKLIVWADWDGYNPINYTEEKPISTNGKHSTYVIAEKLFWRIMTND